MQTHSKTTLSEFMENWAPEEQFLQRTYHPNRIPQAYLLLTEENTFSPPQAPASFYKHYRYSNLFYHSHTFLELIWVYRGECDNFVASTPIHMKQGDICLIPPGISHYLHDVHSDLVCNILINHRNLQDIFQSLFSIDCPIIRFLASCIPSSNIVYPYLLLETNDDIQIRNIMTEISEELINKEPHYEILTTLKIPLLFLNIIRSSNIPIHLGPQISAGSTELMNRILVYLYQHLRDATLTDLSVYLQYSAPYICRIIHQQTGSSFIKILTDFRMHRALEMLRVTDMPVKIIADHCGYPCIEHFYRLFHKRYQCSPLQYRHSHQNT